MKLSPREQEQVDMIEVSPVGISDSHKQGFVPSERGLDRLRRLVERVERYDFVLRKELPNLFAVSLSFVSSFHLVHRGCLVHQRRLPSGGRSKGLRTVAWQETSHAKRQKFAPFLHSAIVSSIS